MKNTNTKAVIAIPSPCGLAITSVASDNEFLYALQPDRKVVYKMTFCGKIICAFPISRSYTYIHYSPANKAFYAVISNDNSRVFVLNRCFAETEVLSTDIEDHCENRCNLLIGGYGCCSDRDTLTLATSCEAFAANLDADTLGKIGNSGKGLDYTAITKFEGTLYEGLISKVSNQTYIRATGIGKNKRIRLQRLPAGYRVNNFFCHKGRLCVYLTKNSFHGFIALVITDPHKPIFSNDIICLADTTDEACDVSSCNSLGGTTTCPSCNIMPTVSASETITSAGACESECSDIIRILSCIKGFLNTTGPITCGNSDILNDQFGNCGMSPIKICECNEEESESDIEECEETLCRCIEGDCEEEDELESDLHDGVLSELSMPDKSDFPTGKKLRNVLDSAIEMAGKLEDKTLLNKLNTVNDLVKKVIFNELL